MNKWIKHFFLMVFMFSLSAAGWAGTVAGKVLVASGTVTADSDGKQRSLKRGSTIYTGETIATGAGSKAQLRFTDSSMITLQPSTEVNISAYAFKKASQEGKSILNFVKGSLRTVTGIITDQDPENFKMKTSVATIGVRGTDLQVDDLGNGDIRLTSLHGTIYFTLNNQPQNQIEIQGCSICYEDKRSEHKQAQCTDRSQNFFYANKRTGGGSGTCSNSVVITSSFEVIADSSPSDFADPQDLDPPGGAGSFDEKGPSTAKDPGSSLISSFSTYPG